MFLPPNCTVIIQPLNVVVKAAFKRNLKNKFLDWMIEKFDEIVFKRMNSDEKVYRGANEHQILSWVLEAWRELSNETIEKSIK